MKDHHKRDLQPLCSERLSISFMLQWNPRSLISFPFMSVSLDYLRPEKSNVRVLNFWWHLRSWHKLWYKRKCWQCFYKKLSNKNVEKTILISFLFLSILTNVKKSSYRSSQVFKCVKHIHLEDEFKRFHFHLVASLLGENRCGQQEENYKTFTTYLIFLKCQRIQNHVCK